MTGILTISDDHQISMNDCPVLELHAWERLLDADNFLAQAKLATCFEGSFVQDLLVALSRAPTPSHAFRSPVVRLAVVFQNKGCPGSSF